MLFLCLQIPNWVPAPLASMLQLLLQPDAKARLRSACGASLSDTAGSSNKLPTGINYDALRGHEMFTNAHSIIAAPPSSTAVSAGVDGSNIASTATDELSTVAGVRTVYDRPALRVPTLRELCLRATGRATLLLAAATAENGGVRPTEPKWMQVRSLYKISRFAFVLMELFYSNNVFARRLTC